MGRLQKGGTLAGVLVMLTTGTQCVRTGARRQQGAEHVGAVVRVGSAPVPAPAPQGRAEGEILPFENRGTDLRAAVLAQPLPEVWLSFDASKALGTQAARVELPAEAKKLFQEQWEVSLAARYDWEMGDTPDAGARARLLTHIFNSSQKTALELTKITVAAPGGSRPITIDEANGLSHFIGQRVAEVVAQAKACCWQR